jgi:hypothetical protein
VAQRGRQLQEHDHDDRGSDHLGHAVQGLVEGVAHEHVGAHQHHDQRDDDGAQGVERVDDVPEGTGRRR